MVEVLIYLLFLLMQELYKENNTDCTCTVVDFRGISSGDCSIFAEGWLKSWDFLLFVSFWLLILDYGFLLFSFLFDGYWNNLLWKDTFFSSLEIFFIRSNTKLILLLSCQFKITNCFLSTETHADFVKWISQSIMINRIKKLVISKRKPFSSLNYQYYTFKSKYGAFDID
jgi:hypothetical protein